MFLLYLLFGIFIGYWIFRGRFMKKLENQGVKNMEKKIFMLFISKFALTLLLFAVVALIAGLTIQMSGNQATTPIITVFIIIPLFFFLARMIWKYRK